MVMTICYICSFLRSIQTSTHPGVGTLDPDITGMHPREFFCNRYWVSRWKSGMELFRRVLSYSWIREHITCAGAYMYLDSESGNGQPIRWGDVSTFYRREGYEDFGGSSRWFDYLTSPYMWTERRYSRDIGRYKDRSVGECTRHRLRRPTCDFRDLFKNPS